MNKYYFNRKPKAAQAEKRGKKTTSKSKPNLVKSSIGYSLFISACVMLWLMVMFGVYPAGR